jgi:hypothetical protein
LDPVTSGGEYEVSGIYGIGGGYLGTERCSDGGDGGEMLLIRLPGTVMADLSGSQLNAWLLEERGTTSKEQENLKGLRICQHVSLAFGNLPTMSAQILSTVPFKLATLD